MVILGQVNLRETKKQDFNLFFMFFQSVAMPTIVLHGFQVFYLFKERTTQGVLLRIYIEIQPVLSDKKIFKEFTKDILGKKSHAHWWPYFLDKSGQKYQFCKKVT